MGSRKTPRAVDTREQETELRLDYPVRSSFCMAVQDRIDMAIWRTAGLSLEKLLDSRRFAPPSATPSAD